ncbi:TetR/AcrR family transcriptional regulator [Woodsholea maritima]|uniref:TetR/AcrR family transcriptional regulator n=1 Tax=Woodsholea maritima TaxID=240237 RepID=UPI00035E9B8C|nr:TetR/AcrR family transcriptional regulator [Woodsholea maritima]
MRKKDEALHARRREEVLEAAARCFVEKGVHQTSVHDICAAAQLSPGGLYRYFRSKSDIILGLAEQDRQELAGFIEALSASHNVAETLNDFAAPLVEIIYGSDYGRLTLEFAAEAGRNPDVAAVFDEARGALREALIGAVERSQSAGVLSDELDSEVIVFTVQSLIRGMTGREGALGALSPAKAVEAFRGAIETLFLPARLAA